MATPLPANVNLTQLLAASPGTTIVGTEPLESVQTGTSVAFTLNQVLTFAQTNFSVGNLAPITGLSVLGVIGTANATPAAIAGTTDQVLRIAQNGTALGFGAINLATTAAVTGILAGANMTAVNLATTGAGAVQGVLPVANGGQGTSTLTAYAVLLGGTTNTATLQFAAATTAGYPFVANGSASAAGFQALNLASTFVTSVLATGNGGIGTSTIGQIPGSSTNDSASAGKVGEYVQVVLASGSAVSLTNNTSTSIGSVSLSPGDWDLTANVGFVGNATTTVTLVGASISNNSASFDLTNGRFDCRNLASGSTPFNSTIGLANAEIPPIRQSLSATTTFYALGIATFATSTAGIFGLLRARRVR